MKTSETNQAMSNTTSKAKMTTQILRALSILGLIAGLAGCGGSEPAPRVDDVALAQQVSAALIAACPMAAPSDEAARAQCAGNLSGNKLLPQVMNEPFMWGAQKTLNDFHLENSNMNRFNVYVWRRMYLSLMMFPGDVTIEQTSDGLTVAHVAVQFRNELQVGSYPYPFWHAKKKWDSYQYAKELLLIFQDGHWRGAMRTADQDTTRPFVSHSWSGQWTWQDGGVEQPYVTLYQYLLSANNPHTQRLDSAYRELSGALRNQSCTMCHSPDNYAASTQLEFFNYPNQALYSRNTIVAQIEGNLMPPANNTLGLPAGIADPEERQEIITLAKAFKAAGDDALSYEGELKMH